MNHGLTGDALRRWREEHRLNQEELGQMLGTSREWIGMLERGQREVSATIYLRFENLKRDPRFSSSRATYPEPRAETVAEAVPSNRPGPMPGDIEEDVRRHIEELIALAGDDSARLGWIKEQLQLHLSAPQHWRRGRPVKLSAENEEMLRSAVEAQAAREKAHKQNHPPKSGGIAS